MRWIIEYKLKKISNKAAPDPVFKAALRKELLSRISVTPWYIRVGKPVVVSLAIVATMGSGTGVYAYQSDDVLPDHPLYPVRIQIESIEERIAELNDERLTRIQQKHLDKRVHEMELMNMRGKAFHEEHYKNFVIGIERAIQSGGRVPEAVQEKYDQRLADLEVRSAKLMQHIADWEKSEQARERIEQLISEEIKDVSEKIEQIPEHRRNHYVNLKKRSEALSKRVPFRINNGDIFILQPKPGSSFFKLERIDLHATTGVQTKIEAIDEHNQNTTKPGMDTSLEAATSITESLNDEKVSDDVFIRLETFEQMIEEQMNQAREKETSR